MNEHDKWREYWLTIGEYLKISGMPVHNELNTIHVREVRPGEITLTRDELRKALTNAFGPFIGPLGVTMQYVEKQLFPEGTEVTK